MNSAVRLAGVFAVGLLLLGAVVGSIWLAQADALMTALPPVVGYALPTPTLFPTSTPREPVLSRPTATEVPPTPASPLVDATATGTPSLVCTIPEGWVYYSVEPGDTFYSLAERAGTTLPALLDGNCKPSAYALQAGEALYLPASALTAPTATPFICTQPYGWQVVTVQRGDTFSSLARRYGIELSLLLSMNCRGAGDTTLYAGQTIYAPRRVVVPPTWPVLPTPYPTLQPPTETLPPTVTPRPTATSTETPVPSPTPTPTETPVLVPTWTPTPPDWELPTAGPPPTSDVPSTATPDPTPTPTADASGPPTEEPPPGATPTASPTPEPTTVAPIVPAPLPTATEAPPPLPTETPVPEPVTTEPSPLPSAPPTATASP